MLVPQIVLDTVRSNDDQELLMSCMWLGTFTILTLVFLLFIGFVFVLETLDVPQCASFPAYILSFYHFLPCF